MAANPDEDIPVAEETHRLAVVDLDWDKIRAVDILAVLRSFLGKGQHIRAVGVYPSDFGLEKMKQEAAIGPQVTVCFCDFVCNWWICSNAHTHQLTSLQISVMHPTGFALGCLRLGKVQWLTEPQQLMHHACVLTPLSHAQFESASMSFMSGCFSPLVHRNRLWYIRLTCDTSHGCAKSHYNMSCQLWAIDAADACIDLHSSLHGLLHGVANGNASCCSLQVS